MRLIETSNLTIRHNGVAVLQHVDFTIERGEIVTIVGPNGSGKTSLIRALIGLTKPAEGHVTPMRGLKIGYVPQKASLFSGSIASNLKLGDKNATETDMNLAIQIAQTTDFVSEKPDGLNENIAQGGANVSGGQKQRLSIARALIKKPKVYIFDDSFSALDYKTDAALRNALKTQTDNATVILVAQRISTIKTADQILVLDEGKLVGVGTHKELLEHCDTYKEIAMSQLSKEELS